MNMFGTYLLYIGENCLLYLFHCSMFSWRAVKIASYGKRKQHWRAFKSISAALVKQMNVVFGQLHPFEWIRQMLGARTAWH